MKKVLSKLLLLLLALTTVFSSVALLAACEKEDPGEDGENTVLESDVLSHLPDKSFNNGKYTILCHGPGTEFLREDSKGDRVDYAIYMRNSTIEDKYKIELGCIDKVGHEIPDYVSMLLKAGDDKTIDIVANGIVYSTHIVVAGNALNIREVPYIDLSRDWWTDSTTDDLTLNEKTFMAIGDMNLSAISATYCMYYNKELCMRYGIGDDDGSMYDIVMNQSDWTYDRMMSYVKDIYEDANLSQDRDKGDLYGLALFGMSGVNAFLWAWDNPIFQKNETTGELEYTFYSNKLPNIVDRLVNSLCYRTRGTYFDSTNMVNGHEDVTDMFVNNRAVFINGTFSTAAGKLRDMESEKWGIVPYPKYNSKQKEYYTSVDGAHTGICIPKTVDTAKIEKIGIITEALNALSHDNLITEYYDVALKSKYIGDPQEAEIIDMLMANRIFDFGYIYLQFESPAFLIQDIVHYRKDLSSRYNSAKQTISTTIINAYEAFGLTHPGIME